MDEKPILSDSFFIYRYGSTPFYYLFFERRGQEIKIQAPALSWRRPNDDAACCNHVPLRRHASIPASVWEPGGIQTLPTSEVGMITPWDTTMEGRGNVCEALLRQGWIPSFFHLIVDVQAQGGREKLILVVHFTLFSILFEWGDGDSQPITHTQ